MATIKKMPTTKVLDKDDGTVVLTDINGRKIKYKALSVLEHTRLLRAVGPTDADNNAFIRIASYAVGVKSIWNDDVQDFVPCPRAMDIDQIETQIARVGDDGYNAILFYVTEQIQKQNAQLKEQADAAIKNLSSTPDSETASS